MDKDELIEKCRLTEEERKKAYDDWLYNDSDCRHPFDVECEAQLRKALPIIQKAERERIEQLFASYHPCTEDEDAYYTILESDWQALKGEGDEGVGGL
jgi:hypothetical protein